MISIQCISCSHYKMFGECDAYPDKIPYEIISGQVDHTKPYKGDNGIQFKSDVKVNKIEIDIGSLNKKEIPVKGFTDKKGHYHKPHTRKVKAKTADVPVDVPKPKVTEMTKENVKKLHTLNDLGMSGGVHDEESFVAEFKDGSHGMYKTMDKGAIAGEVSTYNFSNIMGWNIVPETVQCDFGEGNGSCQYWVEGGVGVWSGFEDIDTKKVEMKHFDDLSKIFIMDMVTGNYDRHSGNVVIDGNDKCWAIDNEDWGTEKTATNFMRALDNMSGVAKAVRYSPMTQWLTKSLDEKGSLDFRGKVIENMKQVIESRDKILDNYIEYTKSRDLIIDDTMPVSDALQNVEGNLDYIEKYYAESTINTKDMKELISNNLDYVEEHYGKKLKNISDVERAIEDMYNVSSKTDTPKEKRDFLHDMIKKLTIMHTMMQKLKISE